MSTETMSPAVEDLSTPPSAGVNNVPYAPPSPVETIPPTSTESYTGVYDEVFPALPGTEIQKRPVVTTQQPTNHLGQSGTNRKLKSSVITKLFHVPLEERRFQEFGDQVEQGKICAEIMQNTGAHIEVSSSKDGGLTILLTGKEEAVFKAKKRVQSELQTQAYQMIAIPKDHHRFILGKKGQNLQELEKRTFAKITVPRVDEESDQIKITGTKESIDKARHEIQKISDEKAKQCLERISIPKEFHIFVTGAFNSNMISLMNETQTRINVPPPSFNKDEITITGERENCLIAKDRIQKVFKEKQSKSQIVSMEVKKSQHKYVFGKGGAGIQEIFQKTGISVEMPPSEETTETIRLRGEPSNMGAALSLVNERANSSVNAEVIAPAWLHKYIIGKKGVNIKEKTQDLDKLNIDFQDTQNKILIEGPKDQVEEGQSRLEELISNLLTKLVLEEIKVDPQYHPRIVGKNGVNIVKIKKDTDVQIYVPSDSSNVIKIEGDPTNVGRAKKMLLEIVHKLENETTKELIIEQRFHRKLIGARGDKIKEIRDKFSQVNVMFPDPGSKSDRVSIRGSKEDVEGCYAHLAEINKTLMATTAKVEVPIYKQFHKFIIGKGGANIRKIREETETNIDLPLEGSDSDLIIITGKKENVLAAQERILAIQNELANIIQVDIIIPAKFHTSLIGSKGRLIRSIMDECGGVTIHFPLENSGSDKVTIRGPKDDVQKAKKILVELSNEKQESNFTVELRAKPDHIRFLIGKNGANVKKLREKTGARIFFPSEKDEDREAIIILGKKEEVNQAKKELEETIKDLDKVTEIEFKVDPRHYRYFVSKRGEILNQISNEFGKVLISFPRAKETSDIVKIKGSKDCVHGAKMRIEEIVQDLESRVTIECVIPQQFHRKVMGAKGFNVQGITQDFNVQIKFPDKEVREGYQNGEEQPTVNGGLATSEETENYVVKNSDVILITGKKENCDEAHKALMDLVPVTEQVEVAYDFHRYIIGQKGKDVKELMDTHHVNIAIPPANDHCDLITITGPPANVHDAKEAIREKVEQLEAERQDKELRSFQLQLEVDPSYHPKIIGKKGQVINEIRTKHNVQVQFPDKRDDPILTITGYEDNTIAARDAILEMVHNLDSRIKEELSLDPRVFSRLIGYKGTNIRKIMKNYEVEIRLPKGSNEEPVVVTGLESDVERAIEHLKSVEDEFLESIQDDEETRKYIFKRDKDTSRSTTHHANAKGFVMKDAPWDTSNTTDFPSIGSSGDSFSKPTTAAWGPSQRR